MVRRAVWEELPNSRSHCRWPALRAKMAAVASQVPGLWLAGPSFPSKVEEQGVC